MNTYLRRVVEAVRGPELSHLSINPSIDPNIATSEMTERYSETAPVSEHRPHMSSVHMD